MSGERSRERTIYRGPGKAYANYTMALHALIQSGIVINFSQALRKLCNLGMNKFITPFFSWCKLFSLEMLNTKRQRTTAQQLLVTFIVQVALLKALHNVVFNLQKSFFDINYYGSVPLETLFTRFLASSRAAAASHCCRFI